MNKGILLIGGVVIAVVVIIVIILVVVKSSNNKYEVIEDDEKTLEKESKTIEKVKKEKKQKKSKNGNIKPKKIRLNSELTDYDEYVMTKQEKIKWSLVGMAVVFCAGYIFYRSIIWAFLLSLIGLKYPKMKNEDIIRKRKEKLLLQFKEALYAISSSLSAGKAVPSAFKDAYSDLQLIFGDGKENYILNELMYINRRIDMNETIEDALSDFGNRSGLEDVNTFSDIFGACTRSGGNLKNVIQKSSQVIGDKIAISLEIKTLISGKKFEARILTVIPFALIFMMKLMAPDLIENLYTFFGRVLATGAIILIGIATLWANKITNIEV